MLKSAAVSAVCIFVLVGCATTPPEQSRKRASIPSATSFGFYHKVEKGQTLWKISRIYGVDMDELTHVNNIREDTPVEMGQLILIPRKKEEAVAARPVVTGVSGSAGSAFLPGEDFIWPLKGRIIAAYGQFTDSLLNKGLNIEPRSNADVYAARSGKVIFYNDNFGVFGKTVIIDHGDGLSTVYTHASDVFVKVGDRVERGTRIARAGRIQGGRPYLHFEIRKSHASQNPYHYLP